MKKQFNCLYFCLLVAGIQAQNPRNSSAVGEIYQLTAREAQAALVDRVAFDSSWLHTLLGFNDTLMMNLLPAGHYLFVDAQQEEVVASVFTRDAFEVKLLQNRRDFAFILAEPSGKRITGAQAFLNGKKVPFDPKMQCYRLAKRKKGGMLKVQLNDIIEFYDIQPTDDYSMQKYRWRRFTATPMGRLVAVSWYWGKNTCYVIRHPNYWRNYWRNKKYRKENKWDRQQEWSGYVAFSQPKYRPGDTLRVKAWVTDPKRKPWNQALDLVVSRQYQNAPISKKTLLPLAPGVFTYDMVLSDSMELDRNYTYSFKEQKSRKRGLFRRYTPHPGEVSGTMRYEDYVLDELKYSFTQKQNTYTANDSIIFHLSARDANGMPISDGTYQLVVEAQNTSQFYAPEVLIPDTLWQTSGMIAPSGETDIRLPESHLPPAAYSLLAKIYCSNSAGELQQMELRLNVDHRAQHLVGRIEKGWLQVDWNDAASKPAYILLRTSAPIFSSNLDTIVLPYRKRVNPNVYAYEISYGDESLNISLDNIQLAGHQTSHQALRVADTVDVMLQNPQQIPVQYRILRGNNTWKEGETSDSIMVWTCADPDRNDFHIYYTFVWGAKVEQMSEALIYIEKVLQVSVVQPETVEPGDQVQVKVIVTDQKNRPVAGSELTAGAYNTLFGRAKPYQTPEVTHKPKREPFLYKQFEINNLDNNSYKIPLTDKWYERLHLDTIPYYQIRHIQSPLDKNGRNCFALVTDIKSNPYQPVQTPSESGALPDLPKNADSFYLQRPQFSPFVITDYQSQPVYLIWVNNVLVYYYGNTGIQPYSFHGEYDYNAIKIRTRDAEYNIDSVFLEKGKKLTFSIYDGDGDSKPWLLRMGADADTLPFRHATVRRSPRPDTLSASEQTYLQKSMLLLRPGSNNGLRYFWDCTTNIQIATANPRSLHILGPFTPYSEINVLSPGGFRTRFLFEPGYEYEIMPQRERLYASNWPAHLGKLPKKLPLKSIADWAAGPQEIRRGIKSAIRYAYRAPGIDKRGTAAFQVYFNQNDTLLLGIALHRDTFHALYTPNVTHLRGLTPGTYQLALYTQNGSIAVQTLYLRRDTLLCLNLSGMQFRPALAAERLDSLFRLSNGYSGAYSAADIRIAPNPFGSGAGTIIQGNITDETGEALIGATVKLMQGNQFIRGAVTDVEGNYRMKVEPGFYSLEVSYTGYSTQRTAGILVRNDQIAYINQLLTSAGNLQEVLISAYGTARYSPSVLTSEEIYSLPTRNVNNIMGRVAGLSIDGGVVNIWGSRSAANNYYIDGIRISGAIPPLQDLDELAGSAQIRSSFRDYAYWQPHLSTDAHGEAVFQATFPDDLTSWNTYAIATDEKGRAGIGTTSTRAYKILTAQVALPRFAIAGDQFEVAGRVSNHNRDSVDITTRFLLNHTVLGENSHRILEGMAEYKSVLIPENQDTVLVTYELRSGDKSDGEERKIPVLPAGTMETDGQFLVLEQDTSLVLNFPSGPYPVTLRAENNALELLLQDVEYLRTYPYACNEQTSSRLLALLALKKINTHLNTRFLYEKDLRACLKKLKSTQLTDGSWGWWAQGAPNSWMTLYVSKALHTAKTAGYAVEGLEPALTYIRLWLPSMNTFDQCSALTLLRACKVNIDCAPYVIRYDTLKNKSLGDKFNLLKLKQLCGQDIVKDSLSNYINRTTFGGIYFGKGEYDWYQRQASLTFLAYDIARSAGWTDITNGIRRYWLQSRSTRRNTIETAGILDALLPELLDEKGTIRPAQLRINNSIKDTFPVVIHFDPAQGQALSVSKTGSGPVFLTAYQQWHNPAPAARNDLFDVHSTLLLANGIPATQLKYGETATLEVRVKLKEAADYVMIEVPIPAGCGYGEKVQNGWSEVHREYFKDRTAIFCERLPVGEYTFKIALEPRFTGSFTLNPVRVEQMYFPVFYGRNEVKKVGIVR